MTKGTEIGRVRGYGSAHHGAHHWLLQRFTAAGNLVLVWFLVISFALLPGFDYATLKDWVSSPLVASALALLIVSVFWHARIGVQVMIEDYVPNTGSRFAVTTLLNLAAVGGAMFGLVSIARIAFTGAA